MYNNIKFFQGNSFDALIPVINVTTGNPVDISLHTATLTVRKKIKDPEIVLSKELPIVNQKIQLSLSSEETLLISGTYIYDIVIQLGEDIKTVVQASIKVMDSVAF